MRMGCGPRVLTPNLRTVRAAVTSYCVADMRKDRQAAAAIRRALTAAVETGAEAEAAAALNAVVETYRRGAWTTGSAVHVVSEACFAPHRRVQRVALYFFLDLSRQMLDEEDSETRKARKEKEKLDANSREVCIHMILCLGCMCCF